MATAVEPSSAPAPSAPGGAMSLPVASLLGAVYVLAALAITIYVVPMLWGDALSKDLPETVRIWHAALQIAVLGGLLWFGSKIAGESSPVGVRGGSFLMAAAILLIFFVARLIAVSVEGGIGPIIAGAVAVVLIYFAARFFLGSTGASWMTGLEGQGWFSSAQYKRSLGVKVRRMTILGILIIGCTGAWTMWNQGVLPDRWMLTIPFVDTGAVPVLGDAKVFIPLLMAAFTFWLAWRAVNVPDFAEFLIATEAEMNKVSWSTRKRLMQDTIVVLLTTILMTLFLLVVDLFWGWLLSNKYVNVLPSRSTGAEQKQVKEAKW